MNETALPKETAAVWSSVIQPENSNLNRNTMNKTLLPKETAAV